MVRRNVVPQVHLGFQSPSLRRNVSQYQWSRPVQNGSITRRRSETWEPPLWIAVPVFAFLGWALSVLLLLW